MMPTTAQSADLNQSGLPRLVYGPRVVGAALGGLCIGVALWEDGVGPWTWALLGFNALAWPHLAYLWARRYRHPRVAEVRNLLLDLALAGLWVVVLQVHLILSVLVFAMPAMNIVGVGGFKLLRRGCLAAAVGALAGVLLWGWRFQPDTPVLAELGSLPFLLCYPILYGWIMFLTVRKLNQQSETLRQLSERDALSEVYNRRFFDTRIAQEFDSFRRYQKSVALVMVDIDDFKKVNDQHGHTTGDELIRKVGQVLQSHARRSDVVTRFGGDEFAVLLPFTDVAAALEFVQRVQATFMQMKNEDERLAHAGMSFGIALPDASMDRHEDWIARADAALYRVKSGRRGGVQVA